MRPYPKRKSIMPFDLWLFDFLMLTPLPRSIVWRGPDYDFFRQTDFIRKAIDQDDVYCIVHCRFSGPAEDQDLEFLHELADFYRSTPKNTQLIYIHCDKHAMLESVEKIHFLYFPEYFAYYYPLYADFCIQSSKLEKKFLCLNKRGSVHRQVIYRGFYNHELLQDSYFSYIGQSDYMAPLNDLDHDQMIKKRTSDWIGDCWPEYSQWSDPSPKFRWVDDKDRNFFAGNIWQQWQGFGSQVIEPTWQQDWQWYAQSFCSVIIETSPNAGRTTFSEKTVRALAMGHPFVLISTKGSVQCLRDLGFDVFDDIIDHSYDEIDDDVERLKQAWKAICEIGSRSLECLQELSDQLTVRRQHNKQQLRHLYYQMFDRENMIVENVCGLLQIQVERPYKHPYKIDNI